MLTIAALCYGPHGFYHQRCLKSILAAIDVAQRTLPITLTIGLNEVVGEDRQQIDTLLDAAEQRHRFNLHRQFALHTNPDNGNCFKYPMMRRMLLTHPSKYVMWFDDDSFIRPEASAPQDWIRSVVELMETGLDLIGSLYKIPLQKGQSDWIHAQPWYKSNPVIDARFRASFFTGGWWCARYSRLQELNYPWPELVHNGGDVMLGVAAQQLGWKRQTYRQGVAINADAGGQESKAVRRGPKGFDFKPIGLNKG